MHSFPNEINVSHIFLRFLPLLRFFLLRSVFFSSLFFFSATTLFLRRALARSLSRSVSVSLFFSAISFCCDTFFLLLV